MCERDGGGWRARARERWRGGERNGWKRREGEEGGMEGESLPDWFFPFPAKVYVQYKQMS